jgi:hypothetical protein
MEKMDFLKYMIVKIKIWIIKVIQLSMTFIYYINYFIISSIFKSLITSSGNLPSSIWITVVPSGKINDTSTESSKWAI